MISAIDIPNYGGHHRRKNSLLTPPDSDGPDSPDGRQTTNNIIFVIVKIVEKLSVTFMRGSNSPAYCISMHFLEVEREQ